MIYIFIISCTLLALCFYYFYREKKRMEYSEQEELEFRRKYSIPNDAILTTYYRGYKELDERIQKIRSEDHERLFNNFHAWIKDCKLNLLDVGIEAHPETSLGKIEIPIDNIVSFSRYGDFYTEQIITGGGGGGSSIGGALAGGLLAGSTGAIIGSRKKTEPIQTINLKHDERYTVIELKTGETASYLIFDSYLYDLLLKNIPNKEINFVHKQDNIVEDVYDRLKKLAELRDTNVISEEEFNSIKKDLLGKI